jgi:hypothetical protein
MRRTAVMAIQELSKSRCNEEGTMMKSAPRLLVLMAVVLTVAGLCGGWKWGGSPQSGSVAPAVTTSAAR